MERTLQADGTVQTAARRWHDGEPMTLWWMAGRPHPGSGWPPYDGAGSTEGFRAAAQCNPLSTLRRSHYFGYRVDGSGSVRIM